MGIIGILMSLLFRMQVAWPEKPNVFFELFLGKWAPEGVMDANISCISYYPRNNNGILCTNCRT